MVKKKTAEPCEKPNGETETDAENGGSGIEEAAGQGLEEKLELAQQEAAQTYDRFLRVAAELDNYKKRATREVEDIRRYANESLLRDLLPVADNLERAIQSSSDIDKNSSIVEGVELTLAEIRKLFDRFQVKSIDSIGKAFDPAFHQAFMTEESQEQPENTVLREFQKGYLLHDRLLRPAMVAVAKAKPPVPNETPEDGDDPN